MEVKAIENEIRTDSPLQDANECAVNFELRQIDSSGDEVKISLTAVIRPFLTP
jgi:hypothetical protein